jgi:hypothetical protein
VLIQNKEGRQIGADGQDAKNQSVDPCHASELLRVVCYGE